MIRRLRLDPDYAEAHRWLAFNLWSAWTHCGEPMDLNRGLAVAHAERAVALDPNDAGNHWVLGHLLAFERRWPESEAAFATALELDPNNADAWAARSDITVPAGQPSAGIEHVQKALRLDPHPPAWYYWELGLAQYAVANTTLLSRPCARRRPTVPVPGAFLRQAWPSSGGWMRHAGRRCFTWRAIRTSRSVIGPRPSLSATRRRAPISWRVS